MRPARSSQLLPSVRSSIVATNESFYPETNSDLLHQSSAKNFLQSCPYRTDSYDRAASIKNQNTEACLKRLSTREDVHGVLVATMDGRILYHDDLLKDWVSSLTSLCEYARDVVRNLDSTDLMQAIRLRTKKYEIIVTVHQEQLLIVMQIIPDPRPNRTNAEEDATTLSKPIDELRE